MSRFFGAIFQVAYVVEDLEATLEHWTAHLGVGPFFLLPMPLPFTRLELRGTAALGADVMRQVALAYSGETQIEIILPGSAPSAYREFLAAGHRGVQHLGIDSRDYDAQLARAVAAHISIAIQGEVSGARFAYLDTDVGFPGAMLELTDIGPQARELYDLIKSASVDWDGRDAIRALS